MDLSGSAGAAGSKWDHDAHEVRMCKDEDEETECTVSTFGAHEHFELESSDVVCMDLADVSCKSLLPVMSTSETQEHFELESSDMACMDLGGVSCTSLLPVTSGSTRTAKRRFRRQRTRQKHRMLQQFPQMAEQELQLW